MPENNHNQARGKGKNRRRRRPIGVTILVRALQTIGTLLLVAVITGSLVCCYAAVYVKTVVMPMAEQTDLSVYTMDENTVIYYYDDDGNPVEWVTLSGEENRELVTYDQIPQDLIDAFVAIEDKRFWEHDGVDWYRTAGAVVNMFLSMRNTFGGSTITQQLVKNVTEYDDGTVKRKVVEIFTALELERKYEKDDILAWYMNEIFLGNRCYGVQAAAKYYFGKDVSELTLAECACLAGITNNPSQYSPNGAVETIRYPCNQCGNYTSFTNEEPCAYCGSQDFGQAELWDSERWNKARQELILKQMADPEISPSGPYITQEEYEAAVAEDLVFAWELDDAGTEDDEEQTGTTSSINPWYVDAVISEVIADLRSKYGYSESVATKMVYSGGLSIYVPYDPEVQAAVDKVYTDRANLDYTSKTGQLMSSAITVIDNTNGFVVAMAGDVGEKTGNRLYNNALATQQPGSSIKPVSVYAPALEMNLITPATISDDNPQLLNGKPWPINVNDSIGWRGLSTIHYAVIQSKNTIAVNVLQMVTPELSYEFMTEELGFTTLEPGRWSSSGTMLSDIDVAPLSMGGLTDGVTTFEMAAAYATFARNGAYTEPTTYHLVKDVNGQVLLNNKPKTEFVIKESTAYYMNSMLTDVVNSGTGYRARIEGQTVAGKTGTTSDVFDLWFVGYTPYYTAAVWTGYPYDENMGSLTTPAVNLWQKVMAIVHEDLEPAEFYEPDGLVSVTVCLDCGKLSTDACVNDLRGSRTQTFKLFKSDKPTEYCSCHVPVVICTQCPILDADGNETGAYHLAGEFCPEESRKEVTMVDYNRVLATEEVVVKDYYALLSVYNTLEDPYCTVHAAPEEPEPGPTEDPPAPEDPLDPEDPANTGDPTLPPTQDPTVPPGGDPEPLPSDSQPPVAEFPGSEPTQEM